MAVITTVSGKLVNPERLTLGDFDIQDIAHALSQMCRYGGHCPEFYSVAQHSVFVAQLVWQRTKDKEKALQGLLHDAHEAYVIDLPRPIREMPTFAFYRQLEERAQLETLDYFLLPTELLAEVKTADRDMLVAEVAQFWGEEAVASWPDFPSHLTHRQSILSELPETARRSFLNLYTHLGR